MAILTLRGIATTITNSTNSRSMQTSTTTKATFLNLPRELRDLIYNALLSSTTHASPDHKTRLGWQGRPRLRLRNGRLMKPIDGLALLRCSSQVYHEFSECIFANIFTVNIDDDDSSPLVDLEQQLPQGRFRERIRFLALYVAIGHGRTPFAELPDLSSLKTMKSLSGLGLGVLLCDASIRTEQMLQATKVNTAKSTLLHGLLAHYAASIPPAVDLIFCTMKSRLAIQGGYISVPADALIGGLRGLQRMMPENKERKNNLL